MRRTLVIFFTLVVATMSVPTDFVGSLASTLSIHRDEVMACVNKTDVTVEDMMHFDEVMEDDLQMNFDITTLKVGCFFACLSEKKEIMTGANVNIEKIKKIVRSKFKGNDFQQLNSRFQVLDTCGNQVKSKTNECEVAVTFLVCIVNEARRVYMNE